MVEEDGYYDVERILGKRKSRVTGQQEYLIKWEGYAERTWEPEINLATIPHMLREFELNYKKDKKHQLEEAKNQSQQQKTKLQQHTQLQASPQAKRPTHKSGIASADVTHALNRTETERKRRPVTSAYLCPSSSPTRLRLKQGGPELPKKRQLRTSADPTPKKQSASPSKAKTRESPRLKQVSPPKTKADPLKPAALKQNSSALTVQPKTVQIEVHKAEQLVPSPPKHRLSTEERLSPLPSHKRTESLELSFLDKKLLEQTQQKLVQQKLFQQKVPVPKSAETPQHNPGVAYFNQVVTDKPNLKTDKVAKIIGAKKQDDSIYYAVLFKVRRDGTMPTVGVYDHNTLKAHKFEGLSEYLLDSIVL